MDNSVKKFQKVVEKELAVPLEQRRLDALKQLKNFRGEVASKNTIRSLAANPQTEVKVGEIFWVEMDHRAYIVSGHDGKKIELRPLDETASISTGMSIYDMNKSIIEQEELFDLESAAYRDLERLFKNWWDDAKVSSNRAFLLYGRTIHYFSLFLKSEISRVNLQEIEEKGDYVAWLLNEILLCIKDIGYLISMDFNTTEDSDERSIEIWVRTKDSKAELLYFFPYDRGIINI